MPDDILDTNNPAPPSVPAPAVGGNIVCQGCGCKLARNGEVLSTGEQYKKYLKHDESVAKLQRDIESRDNEIASLKRQLAEAQNSERTTAHTVGRKLSRS